MQFILKNNIKWVSALLLAAFAGLIIVLVILITKAIETNRLVFINRVSNAVREVPANFKRLSKSGLVFDSLINSRDTGLVASLNREMSAAIDFTMKNYDLIVDYQYGVFLHRNHKDKNFEYQFGNYASPIPTVVDVNMFNSKSKYFQTTFTAPGSNSNEHYKLILHFPQQDAYLLSQLTGLLITCCLLSLILVFVFIFFLKTVLRQKKLAEMKNDFINNLTHEFKTPLFSIGLASGFLKKDDYISKSGELLKYLSLIDGENKRLRNQVDKILQIALIDSDNFLLETKVLDVHRVIKEVVNSVELAIKDKQAVIKLDLSAAETYIEADEVHFKNTIYNLLDNALKYGGKHPEITVTTKTPRVTPEGRKRNELVISIADNGIGMNEEVQKNIFEKFYRAESGNVHTVKGFGLGLSYVKSVMDAHNGSVSLESSPGRGSIFSLHLPL